jgi:hypothetical protein
MVFSPDSSGILLWLSLSRKRIERIAGLAPRNYFMATNLGSVSITVPHFSQVRIFSEL